MTHEPKPADYRRAAALITHRAATDPQDLNEGVRAIMDEAIESGRLTNLLLALDGAYRTWVDQLRTAQSIDLVNELVDEIADEPADQHKDLYNQRAAKAIKAIRQNDQVGFVALLDEVNAEVSGDGGARLVGAVSDVYMFVLPELATVKGREELSRWTIEIARHADE